MRHITRRSFNKFLTVLPLAAMRAKAIDVAASRVGLKDAFADCFRIGTAISSPTLRDGNEPLLDLIRREFNAVTPENCMKWARIQPAEDRWNWTLADRYVDFAEQNRMYTVGHNLIWHSQVPPDLFVSNGERVTSEQLKVRMDRHIQTLVDRYKGRIHAWDVVNEAIDDAGGWRRSNWFEILGPEFMERAFRLARDSDPRATLLYNDYNEHNPGKRKFLNELLRDYRKRSVPIDAVGFQGHVALSSPDLSAYERSIEAVAREGFKIHISELDVDVLPRATASADVDRKEAYSTSLDPYANGLPGSVQQQLTDRYIALFEMFVKHRAVIERVTFWGTYDGESWKNDFPIHGRTNHPLLFDRNLNPKPAYRALSSGMRRS